MKMVEFTRDMRPHKAGETRVVPDAVAEKLIANGEAKPRDSVFDKPVDAAALPPSNGCAPGAQAARGKPYPSRKRG